MTDLSSKSIDKVKSSYTVGGSVEILQLSPNYPPSHRVDIPPYDIRAEPVCFDERCASAHEWIRHQLLPQLMRREVALGKLGIYEFR